MKIFCYVLSVLCLVFGFVFARADFVALATQAVITGALFMLATWLLFRRR